MSSIRYRAEIDGLRAIAVLSVVLYHARLTFIPGGFVGVDIFFVISGFLITSILYREMADRDFAISAFYERRVRRLLPALFAVIIVSGIVSWFVLLPDALKDFGESAVWTMLFVSNVFFWLRTGDYFNAPAETKPLLHT
ncbi:MAG: acyltransferase, partial [Parvibaculum sp.]